MYEKPSAMRDNARVTAEHRGDYQELVDEIYAWLLELGLAGRTDRDVAIALEHEMRVRGASGPSFPSIVAFHPCS